MMTTSVQEVAVPGGGCFWCIGAIFDANPSVKVLGLPDMSCKAWADTKSDPERSASNVAEAVMRMSDRYSGRNESIRR